LIINQYFIISEQRKKQSMIYTPKNMKVLTDIAVIKLKKGGK